MWKMENEILSTSKTTYWHPGYNNAYPCIEASVLKAIPTLTHYYFGPSIISDSWAMYVENYGADPELRSDGDMSLQRIWDDLIWYLEPGSLPSQQFFSQTGSIPIISNSSVLLPTTGPNTQILHSPQSIVINSNQTASFLSSDILNDAVTIGPIINESRISTDEEAFSDPKRMRFTEVVFISCHIPYRLALWILRNESRRENWLLLELNGFTQLQLFIRFT